MVAVAGSPQGQDRAVMLAALDKALEGQKAVTVALKLYTTHSAETLSQSRADAIARSTTTQVVLLATAFICILAGMLLGKKLKHGDHPVLTMCAANATVQTDPAENRKFIKGKATGRIDGMVALAMAVGVMPNAASDEGSLGDWLSNPILAGRA